ncbi:hypothetical protein BKA62DRAFT_759149 [Auriculariales sp. MPI-PUGE-AT-0066]|nr:hypothetical protein BKA62DRAFT_759149 [Auriculariales sp. MPI-PUGE-AT-0066]
MVTASLVQQKSLPPFKQHFADDAPWAGSRMRIHAPTVVTVPMQLDPPPHSPSSFSPHAAYGSGSQQPPEQAHVEAHYIAAHASKRSVAFTHYVGRYKRPPPTLESRANAGDIYEQRVGPRIVDPLRQPRDGAGPLVYQLLDGGIWTPMQSSPAGGGGMKFLHPRGTFCLRYWSMDEQPMYITTPQFNCDAGRMRKRESSAIDITSDRTDWRITGIADAEAEMFRKAAANLGGHHTGAKHKPSPPPVPTPPSTASPVSASSAQRLPSLREVLGAYDSAVGSSYQPDIDPLFRVVIMSELSVILDVCRLLKMGHIVLFRQPEACAVFNRRTAPRCGCDAASTCSRAIWIWPEQHDRTDVCLYKRAVSRSDGSIVERWHEVQTTASDCLILPVGTTFRRPNVEYDMIVQ